MSSRTLCVVSRRICCSRILGAGIALLWLATIVQGGPEFDRALAEGEERIVPTRTIDVVDTRRRGHGTETAAPFGPNRRLHQAIVNTSQVEETEPIGTPSPDPPRDSTPL
eukprot:594228-Rhodomonas_salina.1